MRSVLLIMLVSLPAQASDPLSDELNACEQYCKDLGRAMLGIRAVPFGGSSYRACVCNDDRATPAVNDSADSTSSNAVGSSPNGQQKSKHQGAARATDVIDCQSADMQACANRPDRYDMPIDKLPVMMPKSGKFNVTIVEISDYECSFCGLAQATLDQIKNEYGHDIRFVFLHNPLTFHFRALPAAKAAQAAHRQNKFWAYHRLLFSHPSDFSDEHFFTLARELGLDVNRFKKDYADPTLATEVARQKELAVSRGARGTPAFFINGRPLKGAQPMPKFLTAIRLARGEALRLRKQGMTDSEAIYKTLTKDGLKRAKAPKR